MKHKKRGYNRETPLHLVRDYKLFAIACEGGKTEPNYFHIFKYMSPKITVDIIEDIVYTDEALQINSNKSAPKWVLERALRYIEKEGLNDEDELWFIMDVDRWSKEQLREIAEYCADKTNWNIVLSNPCFEVWLYFHKKADINISLSQSCQEFKHEISIFEKSGYHPYKFIPYLQDAIKSAEAADSAKEHFFPDPKTTKVYQLGEALIKVIGKNDFNNFLKVTLPELIEIDIKKARVSNRRKK